MDTQVIHRGIKRKKGIEDDVGSILKRKLHHELKEVKKAAKKAKILEARKVIKKLKFLRSKSVNGSELRDLEAQLLVLKHLDVEAVGNTAFKTRIRKRKLLGSNEHLRAAIEGEMGLNVLSPVGPGTPAYKAQSKLLSSKNLAEQITNAFQAIEFIVTPRDGNGEPSDGGQWEQAANCSEKTVRQFSVANDGPDAEDDEKSMGGETDYETDGAEEWESGDVSGEVDDGDEDRTSFSDKEETNREASGAHSTFLPSLSVGFVHGESDDSSWEADVIDPGKKKNRRGQRARRAIWEKKYGRNANHKKNEPGQQSFKQRKQQVEKDTSSKRQKYVQNYHAKPDTTRGERRAAQAEPSASQQPLHPSWEAKKRLNEKTKPSIVPSQGKKIVF